ncbi:MAG: imidazolonepropionase [Candidatus Dormibacteraeota bacterium]|nr:imidazolonepropionase [Candidatus Dormibacteraeota bacterium]
MTLIVRNIGRLVTCSPALGEGPLGVIAGGALVAEGERITWVGREQELVAPAGAEELDAWGRAVLPGLIDCHTHLLFAGDRSEEFGRRLRGDSYEPGGIHSTVRATREAAGTELLRLAEERLSRFHEFGVTTVEVKTGYGLDAPSEARLLDLILRLPGTVPTLLAAHIVPAEFESDAEGYVDLVCREIIPQARARAAFCDAWCEAGGGFTVEQCRRVLEAGRQAGLRLKLHAEQLSHLGGAALAAEMGATSADHLEHVTAEDALALARSGTVAVLMPGASMMTRTPYAPARLLAEHGVPIALSTDCNPGTSYSENLQLAVALGCVVLGLTPEEALLGVTANAARAVGLQAQKGRLEPGWDCDLVVLEGRSEVDLAYHYGVNLARQVVSGGRLLGSSSS